MNRPSYFVILSLCVALLAVSGCGESGDAESKSPGSENTLPASLFLAEAPTGIAPIATLKETVEEGDAVTVKVVVGGANKLFVADRAVMTVIDAAEMNPCIAPGHTCATPWDYCCTPPDKRLLHMASVQILGADGRPLAVDLENVDKVKPLSTLIIQGNVGPRADKNSLVIQAQGIFVEPQG